MIFFQGKTAVSHWLVSKDTSAKASRLPRAAISADSLAMEGNIMYSGGNYQGHQPVSAVVRSRKVQTSNRSFFDPEAARLSFVRSAGSSQNLRQSSFDQIINHGLSGKSPPCKLNEARTVMHINRLNTDSGNLTSPASARVKPYRYRAPVNTIEENFAGNNKNDSEQIQ